MHRLHRRRGRHQTLHHQHPLRPSHRLLRWPNRPLLRHPRRRSTDFIHPRFQTQLECAPRCWSTTSAFR